MAYIDDQMGPRRRALVGSLGGNTGISGAMPGGAGVPSIGGESAASAPVAPAPVDYNTVGAFANRMHGYDSAKLADANHKSPKYVEGRIFSHFDPAKGVTPEMVSALNAAGLGTFSGEGDKLNLGGNMHKDYHGVGGTDDVITRFSGQGADPMWGAYTNETGQAQQKAQIAAAKGGAARMANPMFSGSTIGAPLQGDAQANIQQALQGMGAQNQPSRIQQLIAALQGGGQ